MSCCPASLRRLILPLASMLLMVTLSACGAPSIQTTLDPKSITSGHIYSLFVPIFWMALFVFIIVEAVLFYSVFRFRSRGNDQVIPTQWHGNTTIEIMWTIAPAVILGIIFVMTARTMFALTDPPKTDQTINVRVIGHQWWWEFQYPDYKANYKAIDGKEIVVRTASDLHMPVGYLVKYTLESVDVIHSFWIPQLNGKTDLIPGHINKGSLYASANPTDANGYWGQCAEFCGTQHAQMRFRVMVDSPADFDAWMKNQQAAPVEAASTVKEGRDQFLKGENLCAGCHTIASTTAAGQVGPNLTHFGSRKTIAGGIAELNRANLIQWISNPDSVKANSVMGRSLNPILEKKSTADRQKLAEAIADYLLSLK